MLDNISYLGKKSDNARSQFETIADMVSFSENYLPDVYITLVVENGKQYKYQRSNLVDSDLGKWREISGGETDLSNYYNKTESNTLFDNKVDKIDGKDLSTNDYSDTEKQKLSNLADFVDSLNSMGTTATTITTAIKELVDKDSDLKDLIDDNAEAIEKLQKTPAIAVDEKPTYTSGVISYKQEGEIKTTEDSDLWFYYSVGSALYQTIFINGIEKTIESGGIDFDEFVKKENIIDSLESVATDKPLSANMGKKLNDDMLSELSKKLDIVQGEDNKNKTLITDEDGNIAFADSNSLGNKAENISYEHSNYPLWINVKKAIDGIIDKIDYVKPEITSFTVSPSVTTYEKGATVSSLTFNWTYNKNITSQTLTDIILADETERSGIYNNLSSSKTFDLTCSDGQNSVKKSITISFKDKIYYGSASIPTDFNSAFILGLSNSNFATAKKGTYNINVGSGEYGFIAFPQSFGTMSSWYIGGFDTSVEFCDSISFTNASGGVNTYLIYRTGRSGLGSITAEIK